MRVLLSTSVLALVMASSAHAADLIVAPVEMSNAYDWSGFYAGVIGGYGWGNTAFTAGGVTTNIGTSGWLLGVDAGANAQWDMFVLGVEGDVAWSNIGATSTALGASATTTLEWLATLRGRAGVAVEQALIYATAGLAIGGVKTTTVIPSSFSSTHTGWTVGAGVEYAATETISLKAEYAYTDFGAVSDGGALAGAAISIHPTVHAVKVGANFHF